MFIRKYCVSAVIIISIMMSLIPMDAFAQKSPPDLVPITVTKEGQILDADVKPLDHRNFVYTYDCVTKKRLVPGMARKRNATMCIDKDVVINNPFLGDKTGDAYKNAMAEYHRYMRAERSFNGERSKRYFMKRYGRNWRYWFNKWKAKRTYHSKNFSPNVGIQPSIDSRVIQLEAQLKDEKDANEKLAKDLANAQAELEKKPAAAQILDNKHDLILESIETSPLMVGQYRNFTAVDKITTPEGLIVNNPVTAVQIKEVETDGRNLLRGGGLQIYAEQPGTTEFYGEYKLPNGQVVHSQTYNAVVNPASGLVAWFNANLATILIILIVLLLVLVVVGYMNREHITTWRLDRRRWWNTRRT